MYFLNRMFILFAVLLSVMIYDYNSYDYEKKKNEIRNISSKMVYAVGAFSFKSKEYKRFVYDK